MNTRKSNPSCTRAAHSCGFFFRALIFPTFPRLRYFDSPLGELAFYALYVPPNEFRGISIANPCFRKACLSSPLNEKTLRDRYYASRLIADRRPPPEDARSHPRLLFDRPCKRGGVFFPGEVFAVLKSGAYARFQTDAFARARDINV